MATATITKNWLVDMLTSTLGRKLIMALTGLFLILFLVVHLIGNLQLLKSDNGEAFNRYADFMGHNPLIQVISIGNFFFIVLHIITSILLTLKNKAARPVEYAYNKNIGKSSSWASRNMMLLGTIILIFLVVHLQAFWAQSKFGELSKTILDGKSIHDLYQSTKIAFAESWIVGLYVLSMIGLAFHLFHGFKSAFQTLGINHKKYNPLIHHVGVAFAVFVPAAYACIPVLMFLQQESTAPIALGASAGVALLFALLIKPKEGKKMSAAG